MIKRTIFSLLLLFLGFGLTHAVQKDHEKKRWAIQLGLGQLTFSENQVTDNDFYWGENQANLFYANADLFLSPRLALTGGVYWEQDGIMSDIASGIGIKKYSQFGLQAGGKFYFFPKKWVIQPHVGALLITNFGYLKTSSGTVGLSHIDAYPNNSGIFRYSIQCPAFSFAPHVGVDLHIFPSLSLTFDYDYRWGCWGKTRSDLLITQGSLGGTQLIDVQKPYRGGFSIGLKFDFPIKSASRKNTHVINNLLDFLLFML